MALLTLVTEGTNPFIVNPALLLPFPFITPLLLFNKLFFSVDINQHSVSVSTSVIVSISVCVSNLGGVLVVGAVSTLGGVVGCGNLDFLLLWCSDFNVSSLGISVVGISVIGTSVVGVFVVGTSVVGVFVVDVSVIGLSVVGILVVSTLVIDTLVVDTLVIDTLVVGVFTVGTLSVMGSGVVEVTDFFFLHGGSVFGFLFEIIFSVLPSALGLGVVVCIDFVSMVTSIVHSWIIVQIYNYETYLRTIRMQIYVRWEHDIQSLRIC